MIRKFFISISLWLTLLVSAQAVNVVTWNLEWFPGGSMRAALKPEKEASLKAGRLQMKRAQSALKDIRPDVFIATEVRDWKAFEELVSVLPYMKIHVASEFKRYNKKTRKKEVGLQQVCIASRFNAKASWCENWKRGNYNPPRGFAFAVLEIPETEGLLMVYGVHLKSNRSKSKKETLKNEGKRNASAKQLIKHTRKMQTKFGDKNIDGWIIAGDFNTNTDGKFGDKTISILKKDGFWDSWSGVKADDRQTWLPRSYYKNFQPTTFDYIMTKHLGEPKASVVPGYTIISDHVPVSLEIDLSPADDDEAL